MGYQELDGPSSQVKIAITATTPVRAKVGTTELSGRKVVTIQPLDGKCYVYFAGDNEVPTAATVSANGIIVYKKQKDTYEASNTQWVYLLSVIGTTNVIVAERS